MIFSNGCFSSSTPELKMKIKVRTRIIILNTAVSISLASFSKFKEYLNERYKDLKIKKELKKPEYQRKAINQVVREFKKEDKGQLIMACGSGKTLTALQIKERMNIKRTLYLVPSLNLINQTIKEWVSFS